MRLAARTHSLLSTISAVAVRRAPLVLLFWVVLAAGLNIAIPQLEQTVARHSVAFLPHNLPAAEAARGMSDAFGVPRSAALGSIVLVDENGINADDEAAYRQLVQRLRDDHDNVAYLLDTYGTGEPSAIGLSPDGKAINLVVTAVGEVGSTEAHHNTIAIRDTIAALDKPAGLQISYTGPSPTLADLFSAMDLSLLIITAASVLVIALILLVVYRSLVTAMIPLITIGIALGIARPVVSLLGLTGQMAVSNFTIALMTAMVLGATTDYAIFVLGGYHEGRRAGLDVDAALAGSARRINEIVVASGLTIAAAATAMAFAQLGLFRAAGPPIMVAILIAVGVALTVPYALIALLGRRGRIEPRATGTRRWQHRGARVVRYAAPLTAASLIVLLASASVLATLRVNFDEAAMQLGRPDSDTGYALVQRHWGVNEAAPEYLMVHADHDMRTSSDLAALDQVAAAVAALPEVAYVRFLTRPDGRQLAETTVGYQAAVVADGLDRGHREVLDRAPDLARLESGVTELHDGARSAGEQLPELVSGLHRLGDLARGVLAAYQSADISARGLTGGLALRQVLTDLNSSLPLLDAALAAVGDNALALAGLRASQAALAPVLTDQPSPQCVTDALCMRARAGLEALDAVSDGAVGRALRQARAGADAADGLADIRAALPQLHDTLTRLQALAADDAVADPAQTSAQLTELVRGADRLQTGMTTLADGLGQVRGGVGEVTGLSSRLGDGLAQAAQYLHGLSAATSGGAGSGFYLPPQGFDDPRLQAGEKLLMSPDGRTARMMVVWQINPYGHRALTVSHTLATVGQTAATGTSLGQARFTVTGLASMSEDMRIQVWRDFAVCALVAILGVLTVLIVLLRSIAAPLFMVAMVALSFAAAAGASVLVWQHLIGIDLDWSVLPVSFVALIAVGADYSMLFAARIREESGDGMIRGIIRGFGKTGGVITTAGMVFALTMFALMTGRVINLLQIGFMVGTGLIIDITIVRTVLVPAAMALIGDRIWWPARAITR